MGGGGFAHPRVGCNPRFIRLRRRRLALGALGLALAGLVASCGSAVAAHDPGSANATLLRFRVVVQTAQKMDGIVWTGRRFLYVQNTANTVWVAPPAGRPIRRFATMPRLVEETRCVLSPGAHGFPSGVIFCHSPDNRIYEISADGLRVTVFATLPARYPPAADGALAFDSMGHFGYRLLAATGRSGGVRPAGGRLYAIDAHGRVRQIGEYAGPGGADELVIAPRRFGSAAGDALLTVDAGGAGGSVVAMDPSGRTRAIARLPDGLNPIAAIPGRPGGMEKARPELAGLYVTDDRTGRTYMAPASSLARFGGDVIVGTEAPNARFWILRPTGNGFSEIPIRSNLTTRTSLEQAIFVG